jgi:integrase
VFEAEVRRRARTGELRALDAGRELLDMFAAEWLRTYGRASLAPRTLAYYARTWDLHVSPRIGGLRRREVDVEVCQRFAAELAAAQLGTAMRRKVLTIVSGVLQRAFEWGRIPSNPMRAVRFPSNKRAREIRALPPATIEAMRAASQPRDAILISVLAYAGLRPGEALALPWTRIGERTISVHASKTGRRRSVRLLAPLGEDLGAWREERPAAAIELVFPGRNGES